MDNISCVLLVLVCVMAQRPSDEERKSITEFHTRVRESVYPYATNMQMMTYSKKMEDLALEWITHCDTAQPDPTTYPQFRGTTMNIMAVDGTQPVMINAARKWDSEKSNYSFYVDNCRGIFHHYKKMVWATSTELGCAMKRCKQLNGNLKTPVYIVGCAYKSPDYNPYLRPYIQGRSCGRCPRGSKCLRNQCVIK
uniref:SCP domain-containing protein n=1 Tax=Mesocestoides corti TaxID=53468 RepID=A0A5K3EPF1_MESCO